MKARTPETRIRDALAREGPLTGGELLEATGLEVFRLWKTCVDLAGFECAVVGRRYLRLDRRVEGYGRLSPSVKREFLTYTVVGIENQEAELARRARALQEAIRRISAEKRLLARVRLRAVVEDLDDPGPVQEDACFIIAGDIVHEMAHAVDRPETSTGKMVRGSDLDIVVVTRDTVPAAWRAVLDAAIVREKYHLLTHPTYREEIDYVVKPLARVREQLRFDTFEHMVASKILHEGRFLLGSRSLFEELNAMIRDAGVPERIARLERQAAAYRRDSEARLRRADEDPSDEDLHRFFYTREEAPEIY